MRRALIAALLAVPAALGLSACHSPSYLSAKGEQQYILSMLKPNIRSQIKSISCPSDFPPAKGEPYKCSVTETNGAKGHIVGTQSDNNGHLTDIQFAK
jgi:hypothetical protein